MATFFFSFLFLLSTLWCDGNEVVGVMTFDESMYESGGLLYGLILDDVAEVCSGAHARV